MRQRHFKIVDNLIGAMIVGTASLLFAVPFALILFAPAYVGA